VIGLDGQLPEHGGGEGNSMCGFDAGSGTGTGTGVRALDQPVDNPVSALCADRERAGG
jgi:hypothetical protein